MLTTSDSSGLHINRSITLRSVREYFEDNYVLGAWCPKCQQTREIDLRKLILAGHGDMPVRRIKPCCIRCGSHGQKYLWPPCTPDGGRPAVAFSVRSR